MTTETFYVVAVEETANWSEDYLRKHGIIAAFGLYLIRGGEATYCCSLSPSSWGEFMRNEFVWISDEAREKAEHLGLEHENGGEIGSYFNFIDPTKYDSRFIVKSCDVTPDEVDFEAAPGDDADEETRNAYRTAIWDNAREYEQGNCHDPAILFEGAYEKWIAEEEPT